MRFFWGMFFSVAVMAPALAEEIEIAGGVEYFQWQEFDDNGDKLLEETGPRYFVEVQGTNDLNRDWQIDFGGRLYSGTVDYDGQTMSGIPVTTDTDYNGGRVEMGFTRRLASGAQGRDANWLIRFALGWDQWRRGLQDTALSDGTPVSGYVERYTATFARLGVTYLRHGSWALGGGVKAPFNIRETVGIGATDITLHPEGQLSLSAQAEMFVSPAMSVTLEYDSYRFAKSDPEQGYYQPESWQDTFGAAFHYRF